MEHDDYVLDILLHWMKADTVTRNNIFKFIIDLSNSDTLIRIDDYVRNIV